METSDHVPCLISVKTDIPVSRIFRFENYLMEHEHFLQVVQHGSSLPHQQSDPAKIISGKFKNPRRVIKQWQKHLSSLKANIAGVKLVLSFIGFVEEFRDLSPQEWNFIELLTQKLISLLRQQKIYWKQRGTIKWVTYGDARTKKFHVKATIRHNRKLITSLENPAGDLIYDHNAKANLLWESYKERLSLTAYESMSLNLDSLLQFNADLNFLEDPFSNEEIDLVVSNMPSGKNTDFIKSKASMAPLSH